jgi:hypothetical protein
MRAITTMRIAEVEITTTKIRFSADGTPTHATGGRGHDNVGGIDLSCHGSRNDFSGKVRVGRDGEIIMDDNAIGKGEFVPGKIPGESVHRHGPEGTSSVNLTEIAEAVRASQARRSAEIPAEDPEVGEMERIFEITPDTFYAPPE